MKLKYNRNTKLWVVGWGVYDPNQIIKVENESKANEMIKTGYFDEIKEEKKIKVKIKRKKSKKKGDD